MGYTHYYETDRDNPRLDPYLWAQAFVPLVRKIFDLAGRYGIALAQTGFSEVVSYKPTEMPPMVNRTQVRFNGIQANEDFILNVAYARGSCKTDGLPYDAVVVAVLLAAKQVFGDQFHWSSDSGNGKNREAGRVLWQEAQQHVLYPRQRRELPKLTQ